MFNVKLIKLKNHEDLQDFYINLNHLVCFEKDYSSEYFDLTRIHLLDGSYYIIHSSIDDFVDYLVELSGLQKGGESE